MKTKFIYACFAAAITAHASGPLSAQAAGYLEAALKAPKSGPSYSYNLDYRTDDFRGKARIHPSRPKGKRVVLVSPAASALTKPQRRGVAEVDREASKAFWCHSFAKRIPARSARLTAQTDTTATYSFKPIPDAGDAEDAKMMRHLVGTVTVSKAAPAILSFSLNAPKSFKPAFVARIKTFALHARCSRTPDGRTYVSRFDLNVTGSAMMRSFTERQTRIHTRLSLTSR